MGIFLIFTFINYNAQKTILIIYVICLLIPIFNNFTKIIELKQTIIIDALSNNEFSNLIYNSLRHNNSNFELFDQSIVIAHPFIGKIKIIKSKKNTKLIFEKSFLSMNRLQIEEFIARELKTGKYIIKKHNVSFYIFSGIILPILGVILFFLNYITV